MMSRRRPIARDGARQHASGLFRYLLKAISNSAQVVAGSVEHLANSLTILPVWYTYRTNRQQIVASDLQTPALNLYATNASRYRR